MKSPIYPLFQISSFVVLKREGIPLHIYFFFFDNLGSGTTDCFLTGPSTKDGFKAMAIVAKDGTPINQTLCFSVNQAILGAQIGVTYVSPFVGRLDDEGFDGMKLVKDIVEIFKNFEIQTNVLAASIRHPLHCVRAAQAGAQMATIPFKVLQQMTHHSLTEIGDSVFNKDWERAASAGSAKV